MIIFLGILSSLLSLSSILIMLITNSHKHRLIMIRKDKNTTFIKSWFEFDAKNNQIPDSMYLWSTWSVPETSNQQSKHDSHLTYQDLKPWSFKIIREPGTHQMHILSTVGVSSADEKTDILTVRAMWDTGTEQCCIDESLIDKLRLKPFMNAHIATANGICEKPLYLVNIHFSEKHCFQGIAAFALDLKSFKVIIGMQIIKQGNLVMTNDHGKLSGTFSMPVTTLRVERDGTEDE